MGALARGLAPTSYTTTGGTTIGRANDRIVAALMWSSEVLGRDK